MGIFSLGVMGGMLIALVWIAIWRIVDAKDMDKGKLNNDRNSSDNNRGSNRKHRSMDRHIKHQEALQKRKEKLERLSNELNVLSVVGRLSPHEKEIIEETREELERGLRRYDRN